MKPADLVQKVELLMDKANQVLATTRRGEEFFPDHVSIESFNEFRSSVLSFLKKIFGINHPFYLEFDMKVIDTSPSTIECGRGILNAIKTEIESGWFFELKDFISAEIFSDFLEMSKYLLDGGYKDAAAVMIGSILEEHLRQLCAKNSISVSVTDPNGIQKTKKADSLNAELANATVYNKLDQKNITAWLDLRNKAAHGKYNEYTKEQVVLLFQGVSEFIARHSI